MFRTIFLVAAISASGPAFAQHHGEGGEHHGGIGGGHEHWGGAEFSGRGMQNEHRHEGRHEGRHDHEGHGEGRMYNDRWYGPDWCWTEFGIPFRCD